MTCAAGDLRRARRVGVLAVHDDDHPTHPWKGRFGIKRCLPFFRMTINWSLRDDMEPSPFRLPYAKFGDRQGRSHGEA